MADVAARSAELRVGSLMPTLALVPSPSAGPDPNPHPNQNPISRPDLDQGMRDCQAVLSTPEPLARHPSKRRHWDRPARASPHAAALAFLKNPGTLFIGT